LVCVQVYTPPTLWEKLISYHSHSWKSAAGRNPGVY
jgi:hypothetical protein